MWRKDPSIGSIAYCVKRRKIEPIPRALKFIKEAGFDVDSWNLDKNPMYRLPKINYGNV